MKQIVEKENKSKTPVSPLPGEKLPPLVTIVGNSGAGKTTLIEKLIPELKKHDLCVGTIKHEVHGFQMDKPGKDSWRHKQAGATTSIISSPDQIGMVIDVDHDHNPDELIPFLSNVDIILAEGYKMGSRPKIEIFRPEVYPEPLCKNDKNLIALVSNAPIDLGVKRFSTDSTGELADFLLDYFSLA
jgi:molybdopterin-guanine dinucleotide biosynthesis protein B